MYCEEEMPDTPERGAAETDTVEETPDDGEERLRALGVPEAVLKKRAQRQHAAPVRPDTGAAEKAEPSDAGTEDKTPEETEGETGAHRPTWAELMRDPEYNAEMQRVVRSRLRAARAAQTAAEEEKPGEETNAPEIGTDDHGEETQIRQHIASLFRQGEALKREFPQFDLRRELRNETFAHLTSPRVGLSVEDAFYTVHRRALQDAAMRSAAKSTAEKLSHAIQSGSRRPTEGGTSAAEAPVRSFDYAHASAEQREALKKRIRDAGVRGEKIYP